MGRKKRSEDTISVSNIYYESQAEQSQLPSQYDFLEGQYANQQAFSITMGNLMRQFRYQLQLQQKTIFRGRERSQPTEQELLQVTHAIRINFPQKDTYRIIKLLFENLMPTGMFRVKQRIPNTKRTSQSQIRETLYQNNPISKIQRNIHLIQSLQCYTGFKKVFLKSVFKPPTQSTHPNCQTRYRFKKCAASSFIKYGHQIQFYLQQLQKNGQTVQADTNYHYTTLAAVIIESYKFLQRFIINDCKLDIKILVRQQLKLFSNRLIHCRQTLKKNQTQTFFAIVNATYGLADATIDEYEALKFYRVTQRGLRFIMLRRLKEVSNVEKKGENKKEKKSAVAEKDFNNDDVKSIIYEKTIANKQSLELKRMWTIKMEHEFLQIYKKMQHLMDIKRYFMQKYPKYKPFFQGTGLRNRLNQILRASLRRVRQILASHQDLVTVQLTKMDDYLIKYVLKASRTLRVRLMLVDIYLEDCRLYTRRIQELVKQLNQAIADKPFYKLQSYSKSKQDSQSGISSSQQVNNKNFPLFQEEQNKLDVSFWDQQVVNIKRRTYYKPNPPKLKLGKRNKLFKQMYGDDDRRMNKWDETSETASVMYNTEIKADKKKVKDDSDSDSQIRINMKPQKPEFYDNTFYYQNEDYTL